MAEADGAPSALRVRGELRPGLLRRAVLRPDPVPADPVKLAALDFLDEVPRSKPVLVCCELCGEPLEVLGDGWKCACLAEAEACGWRRVDFEREGRSLSDEDLVLLADRYGWAGPARSVLEVARARRTSRRRVRELEARAMGALLADVRRARASRLSQLAGEAS